MTTRLAALPVLAPLLLLLSACGAAPPPPPPVQETVIGPGPGAGTPGAPRKTLVELRLEFVNGCTGKVPNAPAYCECGWEQMTHIFSEDEMNGATEDKAKLAQLKDRIQTSCRSKLPEELVRSGFVEACSRDQPLLGPYCACAWDAYRKTFSAAELAEDETAKSERFVSAKKIVTKACGAKVPEAVAHDSFIQACAKPESLKPFCACAWKTIRASASPGDIQGGLVDMDVARGKIDKACAPLRAAK